MVKALADRLAEAFAEYLHASARREWYESGPPLEPADLAAERFRGIRPAFGYPACPDHTEKRTLFELLDARRARSRPDRELRDAARPPPSAASYLAHPAARYFAISRIARDQIEDYAARKRKSTLTRPSVGCVRISATSLRQTRSVLARE